MPDRRFAAWKALAAEGVETAWQCAQKYPAERIEAAIALYRSRIDAGDDLGPGWIAWRLATPGPLGEPWT